MWSYNKIIPISVLKREYPGHSDEALECAKLRFVEECGHVLAKAVNVHVEKDPLRHAYILTADLITEPKEADMATMGGYGYGRTMSQRKCEIVLHGEYYGDKKRTPRLPEPKKKLPVVVGSFHHDLKREINEWLKI